MKSKIKSIFSDRFSHGARNLLGAFSTQQRQGILLNNGPMRDGILRTFIQPTKAQRSPANMNQEWANTAYRPSKPLSASKVSGSTHSGFFWRNSGSTKGLPPQTGPDPSLPFLNAYIKSRNRYVRGKVSLSKTHYTPYQKVEGMTAKNQWKPVP